MSEYQSIIDIVHNANITGNDKSKISCYLNILLVYMGLRSGAVLEYIKLDDAKKFRSLLNKFPELKPEFTRDPKYRLNKDLLIWQYSKDGNIYMSYYKLSIEPDTNEAIGNFLGYHCTSHVDTLNIRQMRSVIDVRELTTSAQIYAQNCNVDIIKTVDRFRYPYTPILSYENAVNNIKDDVSHTNQQMLKFGFPFRFEIFIDIDHGMDARLKSYDNIEYVKFHLSRYVDDLYNYYFVTSMFVIDPHNIIKHYELFKFLYPYINEELFDPDIDESKYLDLEHALLSSSQDSWLAILNAYHILVNK
jgi:hypothetical protein